MDAAAFPYWQLESFEQTAQRHRGSLRQQRGVVKVAGGVSPTRFVPRQRWKFPLCPPRRLFPTASQTLGLPKWVAGCCRKMLGVVSTPPDGQGAILPTRSSRTQALRHFFIACPGLLIRVCECPRDPSCVVEGFLAFTYLTKHARVAPATQCETAKLVSSFFFVYCLRELARHWQFLFPFVYSSLFLWNHVAICSCSLAQVWYQES